MTLVRRCGVRKYKHHCNTIIITWAWSEWREVEEKFRASTNDRPTLRLQPTAYSCARHEYSIRLQTRYLSRRAARRADATMLATPFIRDSMTSVDEGIRILIQYFAQSHISRHFVPFSAPNLLSPIKSRFQHGNFISVNWFFARFLYQFGA